MVVIYVICFVAIVESLKSRYPTNFLVSKIFGYSILVGAAGMYVPQIIKIQMKKSVVGISRVLFYLNVSADH